MARGSSKHVAVSCKLRPYVVMTPTPVLLLTALDASRHMPARFAFGPQICAWAQNHSD